MPGGGEDRIRLPFVAGKSDSRSRVNGKAGKVRMGGFHLSDGHRDCCSFHCVVCRLHFSARKSSESDGIIANSTERLPYESSLHSGDGTGAFLFEGGAFLFEGGAAAA